MSAKITLLKNGILHWFVGLLDAEGPVVGSRAAVRLSHLRNGC
jgi:hypothetical protein